MKQDKQTSGWILSPPGTKKSASSEPLSFLKAIFTLRLKTMIRGGTSPMLKLYRSVNAPESGETDKTVKNAEPNGTEWFSNYE